MGTFMREKMKLYMGLIILTYKGFGMMSSSFEEVNNLISFLTSIANIHSFRKDTIWAFVAAISIQ